MSNQNKFSVVIADDHSLYREGLKHLIRTQPQLEIIGEAGTGTEAIETIRQLQPDLATIDLQMPEKNGLQLIEALKRAGLKTRFLVVSQHSDDDRIMELIHTEMDGYVLKSEPADEILRALTALTTGRTYYSPRVSDLFLKLLRQQPIPKPIVHSEADQKILEQLSPREIEVIKWLAQGSSTKQIAEILGCSVHTIKAHKTNLMRKIGVQSSMEVAAWVAKLGLR